MLLAIQILGALSVVVGIRWWLHRLELVKHNGLSRAQFVERFLGIGIGEIVSGAVWDHFSQMSGVSGFQPAPSDSFDGTFKMTGEDVDDELEELLQKLGWEVPHSGILREWDGAIVTLSDAVRWVDWIRSKQTPPVVGQ